VTSTNGETPDNAMGNNTQEPCGAVLVCGAGVAGIHASLDLSAAGFRAYLVEEGPGIHGGTAQLDNTAPPAEGNACVMFPKLVECVRDPNVDVFTSSEVIALEGESGSFKATIRQRPSQTFDGKCTTCGEQQEEIFDLEVGAVLLTKGGRESLPSTTDRAQSGDRQSETTPDPFLVLEETEGIADAVIRASAAAARVMTLLAAARGSLVRKRAYPPERDITDEPPRVGVFVCGCGAEIASVVNLAALVERVRRLPYVVTAETDVYACGRDGQDRIVEAVVQHRLNRVVIAACSPQTHEPMFRDTLRCAGLNPNLLEIANIRDQCSRVHADRPKQATAKAIDLVRMAVGRAAHLVSLADQIIQVNNAALVIGGGVPGMTAALALADQGYPVHLVEANDRLGDSQGFQGTLDGDDDPTILVERVDSHDGIQLHLEAVVTKTDGRAGNFTSAITRGDQTTEVQHGVVVVACGTAEQESDSSSQGQDESVQTRRADREELARLLRVPLNADGFYVQADAELRPVDSAREGVFLCDAPDAPGSVIQAKAVGARAASILSRDEMPVCATTAWVDPQKCISCMTCVHVCPFMAPQVGEHNKSEVQSEVCMGCGTCSAECPAKAITLQNYVDDQILGAIDSLLAPDVEQKELVLTYPEQAGIAPPRWHASIHE